MKNLKSEIDDLRPEYNRSDFGEIVRGKYGATQVDFADLVNLLLSCIAEDDGLRFSPHQVGNFMANRRFGEWTYEIGVSNQITLRYWLDSLRSIEVSITNPACVMDPKEKAELQASLIDGVEELMNKVRDHEIANA